MEKYKLSMAKGKVEEKKKNNGKNERRNSNGNM